MVSIKNVKIAVSITNYCFKKHNKVRLIVRVKLLQLSLMLFELKLNY